MEDGKKTQSHTPLTTEALQMHNSLHDRYKHRRYGCQEERVKVFTPRGVQIGLPGIGEGDQRLTFPKSFLVGDALNQGAWICESTTTESEELPDGFGVSLPVKQKWWRFFEGFEPRSLIHANGCFALDSHPMGAVGCRLTAIAQEYMPDFEDKPCADVDSVATPCTPSSNASD